MKGRWERMHQMLNILSRTECTVVEMRNQLILQGENLYIRLIDVMMKHYYDDGLLNRKKDRLIERNPYRYSLSKKGMEQLEWLLSGGHLKYIERYNTKYNIQQAH